MDRKKEHLYKIRRILASNHKISKKSGDAPNVAYQLQIRNPILTNNLINLGVFPRKTYNLNPIKIPEKYFSDFVRGFFDGDGSVYIYNEFNKSLCEKLKIRVRKVRGLKEESDPIIRLANAVAGFLRDYIEEQEYTKTKPKLLVKGLYLMSTFVTVACILWRIRWVLNNPAFRGA